VKACCIDLYYTASAFVALPCAVFISGAMPIAIETTLYARAWQTIGSVTKRQVRTALHAHGSRRATRRKLVNEH
jgi:hypothetical protein